jgi:hypothetical protein
MPAMLTVEIAHENRLTKKHGRLDLLIGDEAGESLQQTCAALRAFMRTS